MRAAVVDAAGEAPHYGDFAEPTVGEGRELVELVASGIHPVVRSLAAGTHYGSTGGWPIVPGVDAVARTADGALIYTGYAEAPWGTLAERISVPGRFRMELPPGSDPVAIAGGLNPGLATWLPLASRAAETALGTVLVLGVTGMAGTLAVQNALALGATRVIGAGRSATGLETARRLGASTVALSGDRVTDAAALADALEDGSPSIVLDLVWGSPAEAAWAALSRHGLDEDSADISYVQIGSLAGAEASLPSSLLRSRRIRVSGSGAGSASVADMMAAIPDYMRLIAEGRVEVPTQTFPLSEVREAWLATDGPRAVVVP
jgi:NADPH:quinone reductase-like Zn-dependent oxidoreductase